jgi:nitroreductase
MRQTKRWANSHQASSVSLGELAAGRRTHKAFGAEPVPRATLLELFELAQLAPNHHLTQPWRFRVIGPESLARLKDAAGPSEADKLDRAPTLVVASATLCGELLQDEEDVCATAAAIMLVLLGATERGLASYWRTPEILRTARGREAIGIPAGERVLGLIHLGPPAREPALRERGPVDDYVEFLP